MRRIPVDESNMGQLVRIAKLRHMSVGALTNLLIDFSLGFPQQVLKDMYDEMTSNDFLHVIKCLHCKRSFRPSEFAEHEDSIWYYKKIRISGETVPLWREVRELGEVKRILIDERNVMKLEIVAKQWKIPFNMLVNILIASALGFSQYEGTYLA